MRQHFAQGEGKSLGEWRIGVISLRPLTIHQERQNDIMEYKVIARELYIFNREKLIYRVVTVSQLMFYSPLRVLM
jgi:hypothetical protein